MVKASIPPLPQAEPELKNLPFGDLMKSTKFGLIPFGNFTGLIISGDDSNH